MNSLSSQQAHDNIDGVDLLDLQFDCGLRIEFENESETLGPPHVVFYRLGRFPDELLVVSASAGTPGLARLERPLPMLTKGCYLDVIWQDVSRMGWRINGVISRISTTWRLERLPEPIRKQLEPMRQGSDVISLDVRRRHT